MRGKLSKISAAALYLIAAVMLFAAPAHARVYIDLAAPSVTRLPIAVQEFKYTGAPGALTPDEIAALKESLRSTLTGDLVFSGLFNVIDREAYIEDPGAGLTAQDTNFRDWRAGGAETLVKGSFSVEKGRLTVDVRFFDCVKETQILGKRYIGSQSNPRRLAHYFADQIYETLTGKKGVFSTRIAFVSGGADSKELYVADYDGKNLQQITKNRTINLSPQWSPEGKRLLYTSYKNGWPALYMLNLTTGKDELLSNKKGINIGGRFSPTGQDIALTLSMDKSPELYLLNLKTREYKKLTDNWGIDVSPSWSPDAGRIAYTSDIAGNPHIHMLDLTSGGIKRLTFQGKYNASPAFSPDGKMIAYSRTDAGAFNIWVMRADGSGATQLTFEGDNTSPSWSPDGRYIIYSSAVQGRASLYIMQADGSGRTRVDSGLADARMPAWSPHLN